MTVRKTMRRKQPRWVLDIPYKTADGCKKRFRKDAQVQTRTAAYAEHARLLCELGERGELDVVEPESTLDYGFSDAVSHFRRSHALTRLKHSTRKRYDSVIETVLNARFDGAALREVDFAAVTRMDAELASNGLKPATRANAQVVLRSILRCACAGGMLAEMPRLPRLPKVGQSVIQALHPDELTAILGTRNKRARLVFALAAFAGLRAGEIRGLRWTDVDLKRDIITIRRSIVDGVEDTPKSGNGRTVPIAAPLRPYLEWALQERTSPWSDVALTSFGKPWGDSRLNQAFGRAMAKANLRGWSFHSLRHFLITELCRRGAPTMTVKQLAGHAALSTHPAIRAHGWE